MRIVIATAQVPFIRGGAELHAEGLRDDMKTCDRAEPRERHGRQLQLLF